MAVKKKPVKKKAANKTKPKSTVTKKAAARKSPVKSIRKKAAPKKARSKVAKRAVKKAAKKLQVRNIAVAAGVFNPNDVKERIITNSPFNDLEVSDLTDEQSLKDNLGYLAANFVGLNVSLDEYVNDRDGSLHVSSEDMASCKTVATTIKMVKTKLNA